MKKGEMRNWQKKMLLAVIQLGKLIFTFVFIDPRIFTSRSKIMNVHLKELFWIKKYKQTQNVKQCWKWTIELGNYQES